MKYQVILPPLQLRPVIRYGWLLESDGDPTEIVTFHTIADGSPGLIFQHWGSDASKVMQGYHVLPPVYLYGQSVRPTEITMPTRFQAVGIYFYPNALQSVFGLPASEWTDNCIALDALDRRRGQSLINRLLNERDSVTRVTLLMDYVSNRQANNRAKQDAEAIYAIRRIEQTAGRIALPSLLADLRITERSLERKFLHTVGINPKLFARICQFQSALNQIRVGNSTSLTRLALASGYADQSHFIRNFNAFTGMSPRKYMRMLTETLPNFPQRNG